MKNLAIIPVRVGSKRLPEKNIRSFFGKPLFIYTLEAARDSGLFNEIHVSTESENVAKVCEDLGYKVDFLRPLELSSDDARLKDVCAHVLEKFSEKDEWFDNFCLLWATSPMRTAEDIKLAYELLAMDVDAVVGVTDYDLPVYCAQNIDGDGNLSAVFPDTLHAPSSSMPKVICDNGSLCWVNVNAFNIHGTWLPPKLKGYHMPRQRSVDIDTQADWDLAEYWYTRFLIKSSESD